MAMAPYYVPLGAAIGMALLAAWLLRVNPGHEATRAFSFVLLARGGSLAALTWVMVATSVETARVAATLYPSLCLATIFGVAYFIGVYPAHRRWLPGGLAGPALIFVPLLALLLLIFRDPDLVRPMALLREPGAGAMIAWILGTPAGPFGITPTVLDLTMAVPAFILIQDYVRAPRGKRRDTLRIVCLGFFAPAACSCLVAGAVLQLRAIAPGPANPSIFNYLEMAVFGTWFVVLTLMLVYLGVHALRSGDAEARREPALFAAVLVVSGVLGGTAGNLPDPIDSLRAVAAMVGFWSALGAALVGYGVLRYSLFDIDLRLKLTVQRSTVAAVFVAAYFLVSEGATVWFSGVSGSEYFGIAAAALLLLALHPIQRLARRLAGRLMPGARPLLELERDEQVEFYREHVDLMWMDGHLSPKDRLVLANLRTRLGLHPETAERIELEVLAGQS